MNSKGYLSEIFSSFQGEGGTVRGSCFGKRQIFIRFSGCNLACDNLKASPCFWCDSKKAQKPEQLEYWYEVNPYSQEKSQNNNPIEIDKLIKLIKNLITNDLHSISFTGGEPLLQIDFLIELIKNMSKKQISIPLYLETNGTINLTNRELELLGKYFKYCCCDIKDRSSKAILESSWTNLVERELNFIHKSISIGIVTFAKIVVTSKTRIEDIEFISKELSKIKYDDGQSVGLAIQPVYLESKMLSDKYGISNEHFNKIFHAASKYLDPECLSLSIQAHKYLKIL
ncbi:MAG: 7-carboxy-7-deazaguanine synthase QueE [Candidatus Lokiarchaeota archaeon]